MQPASHIAKVGDPVLQKKAHAIPLEEIRTPRIKNILQSMRRAMRKAHGIGIAAPQIGLSLRIFLVGDLGNERTRKDEENMRLPHGAEKAYPRIYINPWLLAMEGELLPLEEGCLSVPGLYGRVPRRERVRIEAYDTHGRKFTLDAQNSLAHVIQHEMDHLEGILFVDKALETFVPPERTSAHGR